jgi:TolB-like protein/DNA-binding winged helix-turn-helix (wHTH) protein/Tfp pilus assembly protein PilF
MNEQVRRRYEFGCFVMDPDKRLLYREGELVSLAPKILETLLVLIENRGRVLTKDELLSQVWGDTIVEEGGLTRNISILRKALGERPDEHQFIVTVPARGYQFVAEVHERTDNGRALAVDAPAGPMKDFQPKRTLSARHWQVLGGLVALTLAIIVLVLIQSRRADAKRPEIRSIAVLPLQNLSGDPTQEYFVDGMTEVLISNLAQIRALKVISRTSVMSFKGNQKPLPSLPQIARQLGVDGVIEGSVQRDNGRVKVMIQLVHGPTDTHLWARDYERTLTDVLKLQGEMARAIADEVRIQVGPEERARMSSAASVNPAAHQEYLLGRYHFWKFIVDDNQRALDHFIRATQIEPGYAAAFAGLSMAWQRWAFQGPGTWKKAEPQARAATQKALELDDRLPEAHVAQGQLQYRFDWDWRGAENATRRALELDSNNLDAHFNYALLLMALGRLPEALAEIQTVEQLDPLSHMVQVLFGRILFHAGKPEEAILRLQRAIEREPRSATAIYFLGGVYEHVGRYSEALAMYEKHKVLRGNRPDDSPYLAIRARVYARMGKRSEAKSLLKALKPLNPDFRAAAYAALGENDEAFRLLFQKVENREETLFSVKTDPQFASLHSDARWKELLHRMNFREE